MDAERSWSMIHAERRRLGEVLDALSAGQWRTGSLCAAWTVEQVVAHLTAAASTGTWAWLRSMVRAGFNAGAHNDRLLRRYLGQTPAQTLGRFHAATTNTIAPTKDHAAWLGEVIVHSQDIAHPLGIGLTPDPAAVIDVARFFAARDFAVHSRSMVKGLRIETDDSSFTAGEGPVVRGRGLALVMTMAGRPAYGDELGGDGADELRRRLAEHTRGPVDGPSSP